MKQPGFFDDPTVWSAIGSLGMGIVILVGHTFHGTPYSAQDLWGISGGGTLAWLFALARYYTLWPS